MGEKRRVSLDINQGLKAFNSWFDEFILVAAKPLAMLGFAMGTVDIFVRGTLATQYWFAFMWASVQGLTIDGLFFTVWWRIFAAKWEKGHRLAAVGMVFIGVVLGIVATLTNSILGLQQLWGYSDSQQAMVRLGIDPFWFSIGRAVLVVTVSTMVAFVTYKSHAEEEKVSESQVRASENQMRVREVPALRLPAPHEKSESDQILTGDRVREAARTAVQTDKGLNLNQFARETGIPLSTLYRWKNNAPINKAGGGGT